MQQSVDRMETNNALGTNMKNQVKHVHIFKNLKQFFLLSV